MGDIWKIVGGVSAITGLVCFGLSSTYDMSFGKLGYGGPLVYLFVCSFMLWLMIWGKRIQVLEKFTIWGKSIQVSEKFKGVVGAILFVVISSISVVYEKYVPEKSDAYTIASYGSFGLMSVSLSTKLELGFETGFSAFFLQLFAIQLFKIKWFLLPIALVYCSLIIILRHYPVPPADNERSQDSGEKGEVSEQRQLSTNKEQNSQEESSQATLHSPSNYGQLSEENIPDNEDSEQNNEQEEDHPPSVPFEDQVSSENNTLMNRTGGIGSSAEPEVISAAASGPRRRHTNIQNKQEEDSTSSSLAPRMCAVFKFDLKNDRAKQKALKAVSGIPGIDSFSMDMNQEKLTVMGTFDTVVVVSNLRKFCPTELVSVGQVKEPEKKEEPKEVKSCTIS